MRQVLSGGLFGSSSGSSPGPEIRAMVWDAAEAVRRRAVIGSVIICEDDQGAECS